jgi:hypothetical protein
VAALPCGALRRPCTYCLSYSRRSRTLPACPGHEANAIGKFREPQLRDKGKEDVRRSKGNTQHSNGTTAASAAASIVGYTAQARHHLARTSRRGPRLLSAHLQRRPHGVCRLKQLGRSMDRPDRPSCAQAGGPQNATLVRAALTFANAADQAVAALRSFMLQKCHTVGSAIYWPGRIGADPA